MPDAPSWAIAVACAYLVGSIPFGYLVARAKGIDIRAHGSGNIGATNVGRVLGKRLGRMVFFLDFAKGALPVAIAGYALGMIPATSTDTGAHAAWACVALATILGHVFPIYLRFKGGKGVATTFGALLALWPFVTIPCAIAMIAWVITLKLTRYVSVASCIAAIALPIGVLACADLTIRIALGANVVGGIALVWPYAAVTALIAALVVLRHRGNLARVRAGTEPKVGVPRTSPGPSESVPPPAAGDSQNV